MNKSESKIDIKPEKIQTLEEDPQIVVGITKTKLSITGKVTIPLSIRKKMHFKTGVQLTKNWS